MAGVRARALERLRPELLVAVREHETPAMLRLSALFSGLGAGDAVKECYVQCAQVGAMYSPIALCIAL